MRARLGDEHEVLLCKLAFLVPLMTESPHVLWAYVGNGRLVCWETLASLLVAPTIEERERRCTVSFEYRSMNIEEEAERLTAFTPSLP